MHCLKSAPALRPHLVFFVAVHADGGFRPQMERYLQAWHRPDTTVVLIVQSDEPVRAGMMAPLAAWVDEIWVRANVGFDFGAWADAYRRIAARGRLPSGRLVLTNDSVIGPLDPRAFDAMVGRLHASQADIVALTDSREFIPHLQSYLLAFGPRAQRSPAIVSFLHGVQNKATVWEVVSHYEIPLAGLAGAAGLQTTALFPTRIPGNPTLLDAAHLLRQGFPFVKRRLFEMDGSNPARAEIAAAVRERCVDPLLRDFLIEQLAKGRTTL